MAKKGHGHGYGAKGKSSSQMRLCANCKHWKAYPEPEQDFGRCTVKPPVIVGTLPDYAGPKDVEAVTHYPITLRTEEACDEFDD